MGIILKDLDGIALLQLLKSNRYRLLNACVAWELQTYIRMELTKSLLKTGPRTQSESRFYLLEYSYIYYGDKMSGMQACEQRQLVIITESSLKSSQSGPFQTKSSSDGGHQRPLCMVSGI